MKLQEEKNIFNKGNRYLATAYGQKRTESFIKLHNKLDGWPGVNLD